MKKGNTLLTNNKSISLLLLCLSSYNALAASTTESAPTLLPAQPVITFYGSAKEKVVYQLPNLDKNTRHILCHIMEQTDKNTLEPASNRKAIKYAQLLKMQIDGTWAITVPKNLKGTLFFTICKVITEKNGSKTVTALPTHYVIEGQAEVTNKRRTLHASASKERVLRLHALPEGQEYVLDPVAATNTQPRLEEQDNGRIALIIPKNFKNIDKKETTITIHAQATATKEQKDPAAYTIIVKNAPTLMPGGITEE